MSDASLTVRKAKPIDLTSVAMLHREMFRDQFLGYYPTDVIRRFYASFLPTAVFVVALDEEEGLLGFVMGGRTEVLDRSREVFLKRNLIRLAALTLVNPRVWPQAWRRLVARFSSQESRPASVSTTSHRLLSIAVSPRAQGRGVAGRLVAAFEESLGDAKEYGLSVEADNERAIGFYEKMGMRLDGRWGTSVFFRKTTNEGPNGDGAQDRD